MEKQDTEDGVQTDGIRSISMQPASINEKVNHDGETLLHLFVRRRNLETAAALMEAGADVNMTDYQGNTPFSVAMARKHVEMVQLLLAKGNPNFDMTCVRQKFFESLIYHQRAKNAEIAKLIVGHGFTVKEIDTDEILSSTLWGSIIIGLGDTAVAQIQFRRDLLGFVDDWYQSFLLHTQPFDAGLTEILGAITKIRDMFIGGENIEAPGTRNCRLFNMLLRTPGSCLMMVNRLVTKESPHSPAHVVTENILQSCYDGENPVCDDQGRTELHYAASQGHSDIIKALLDMNLDINARDINGLTPLDYFLNRIDEIYHNNYYHFSLDDDEYDAEFHSFVTRQIMLGSYLFIDHVVKLNTAKLYVSNAISCAYEKLLDKVKGHQCCAQGFISLCKDEIELMKSRKLGEFSYYDFLVKPSNQMAIYAKRVDVIDALQLNDDIQQLKLYGKILQHNFRKCYLRGNLFAKAECILFNIMKLLQIPIEIVRQILNDFSNEELFIIVLEA